MNNSNALGQLTAPTRVGAGAVVRRPRGRIPSDTKDWMEVNGKQYWKLAICKCGRWYHGMDHLAPKHTEKNWCPKCGIKQDWNGPDA